MAASDLEEGKTYTARQLRDLAPHARGVESTATIRSLMAALNTMQPKPAPVAPRPDPLDALLAEDDQPDDSAARLAELLRAADG